MARRYDRRGGHSPTVQRREVSDRPLHRPQSMASSYGAAGSLIIVLLWIYYSAQIFLLGAEFTKVYAVRRGSHQQRKRTLLEAN